MLGMNAKRGLIRRKASVRLVARWMLHGRRHRAEIVDRTLTKKGRSASGGEEHL